MVKIAKINESRFEGARRTENLVADSELPVTQNITTVTGNYYAVRIGSNSDNLATVTFSDAFVATLTSDNTNSISTANGLPLLATTDNLVCTISGNIRDFQVEDVTEQINQKPSEYIRNGGFEVQQSGLFTFATTAASITGNIVLSGSPPNYQWNYSDGEMLENNLNVNHTFSPSLDYNAFSLSDNGLAPFLKRLFFSTNQLTGNIPDFSSNTDLQYLYLQNNQLTGNIPDFSSNTALQRLWLHNNQLTGNIPDFSSNTDLQYLYLYTNQLTGNIPDFSSNTDLVILYLATNTLTGNIPDFSSNTALQRLWLQNNQLTGNIPDFSSNTDLQYLWLYTNQLTGNIPDFSSNTALQYLYLYTNQLTGWNGGTISNTINACYLQNNDLDVNAVNGLLIAFDNAGRASGNFNSSGGTNATPTGAGLTAKNSLISKGWTVATN